MSFNPLFRHNVSLYKRPPMLPTNTPVTLPLPSNAERLAADAHAPKLLDQLRARIRARHYSIRTEDAYVDWTRRFILHFDKRHPRDMGGAEFEQFLSDLAVRRNVPASTQNQAKSALLFLYRDVLGQELDWLQNVTRARVCSRTLLMSVSHRTDDSRCRAATKGTRFHGQRDDALNDRLILVAVPGDDEFESFGRELVRAGHQPLLVHESDSQVFRQQCDAGTVRHQLDDALNVVRSIDVLRSHAVAPEGFDRHRIHV